MQSDRFATILVVIGQLVIHKSYSTGLPRISDALDKDGHVLHAHPDRLYLRLAVAVAVALARQNASALHDQSDDRVELRDRLRHGHLVQDERRLPLVGLE